MPDAIDERHADDDDAHDDPRIRKPGALGYHWPILTNFDS
jgi:hypothetical protein